jgi:hypothetical protein
VAAAAALVVVLGGSIARPGWHRGGRTNRFPREFHRNSEATTVLAKVWRTLASSKHYGKDTDDVVVIPPLRVDTVDIIGAADAAVGGLTAALADRLPIRYCTLCFCDWLALLHTVLGWNVVAVRGWAGLLTRPRGWADTASWLC